MFNCGLFVEYKRKIYYIVIFLFCLFSIFQVIKQANLLCINTTELLYMMIMIRDYFMQQFIKLYIVQITLKEVCVIWF